MQLKSLEIHGFKSFANKEKFLFDQGVTGIVGPNGCGKSNIVDAIRWVLGEQKTRMLRSDKMENIIFNGTKDRRKSSYAEVSLTFDNTRNVLPTEYTTVTISRKLFRSGDSEYLINGITCRLKDINNLFMDTGISSDSYAIIELKMVDEMLTNKNNERRRFFEEASGISKYKIRKKQTLKRIQDTDADLERVEDLIFEIEKNLRSLEKQAQRTQRYFELKEAYRLISSRYAYLRTLQIRQTHERLEREEQEIQDQLTAIQASYAQKEADIQEHKRLLLDGEKKLSLAQQELNQHLTHIQEVETQKSVKNERLKYLQQRELAIINQIGENKSQIEAAREAIAELSIQREKFSHELVAHQKQEQSLKEVLGQLRQENDQRQETVSHTEELHRQAEQALQSARQELEINGVKMKSLEAELERAEDDKRQRKGDMSAFAEKKQELQGEITQLESHFDKLQTQQAEHEQARTALEHKINELKDQVYKRNRMLDARQNEYNLTKSLVENLEGFPESVKFLKKNAKWIKDAPLLSDIFSPPEGFKVAFENYLEPWLNYYVVASREDAALSVHLLAKSAKGRANFFILDELADYQSPTPLVFTHGKPALELVDFAPQYKKLANYLLGHVYVVESEADIPEQVPEGTTFLVKAGNVTRRRFMMSGGSLGLFEGKRLGRAKNLEILNKDLKKLNKELTSEKLKLDKAQEKLSQLKKVSYQEALAKAQKSLHERQRDLSVMKSREQEHQDFIERVGARTSSLLDELKHIRSSTETLTPKLRSMQEELTQLTERLSHDREAAQKSAESLNLQSVAYNEANISLIQLTNQDSLLSRDMAQKKERVEHLDEQTARMVQEKLQIKTDIEEIVQSTLQDDTAMMALYETKKTKEEAVGKMEQHIGEIKNQITETEDSLSHMRRQREDALERKQALTEEATEVRIQMNSLQERMAVEFQIDLKTLDPEALFTEKKAEKYKLEKLEGKVHKLRDRVHNFGEINPLAVEAFNEMQERHQFIESQKQDLLDARQSLLDTIAEIDETAQQHFMKTFEQVREHFRHVYKRLFTDDSSSDLMLRDPENPLESDIAIIAKPKGKRPLTISQLSGGEKTLTAVALLFSIYLIKPAPFCVFDEVDAPLDDANIDKFNNIIREFSEESQFIIVTHNKRTMVSTNTIYGVTMEDRGVSRVLPVDLDSLNLN